MEPNPAEVMATTLARGRREGRMGAGSPDRPPQSSPASDTKRSRRSQLKMVTTDPPAPAPEAPEPGQMRPHRIEDGIGDPDCPLCHGMGYVSVLSSEPGGDPETRHCPGCPEHVARYFRDRASARLRTRIDQHTVVRAELTFEAFDTTSADPTIRHAYREARRFAAAPKGWLVLHGDVGTGKTHLACAIANANPDVAVLGLIVPDLLDLLRGGVLTGEQDVLLDLCRSVELLILDDLGTERSTPYSYEKLYQIIDHRYRKRQPTVFSFNGSYEGFDRRLASRLQDRSLAVDVPMYGPDYRRKRRKM